MLPSMYAKLFSRIAQSSLMEQDVETRYCFMMLLAIADSGGDVIGTDVALARAVNLPLATFKRCAEALMSPDPDSNSQIHDGRRLVQSESGRGYLVVNYVTYRSIKTAEEKKTYMREYMKRYRKTKSGKDVTDVNVGKSPLGLLAHAEGEGEGEGEGETEPPAREGNWPDLATVKNAARNISIPAEVAEIWWNEMESAGWNDRSGKKVIRWQNALAAYGGKWKANNAQRNGRKESPADTRPPGPARVYHGPSRI